jgi:hypothetical protein
MGKKLLPAELSEHLKEKWRLKKGPRTLQQMRMDGGGPRFHRNGHTVIYDDEEADVWAIAQLGEPVSSTAEEAARRQADQSARTTTRRQRAT